MTQDEREDCPAEHLVFSRDDSVVLHGYSTTPGACDLRMDCADCRTWAIARYHPDWPLDSLFAYLQNIAPGKHTAPFEAYIRAIRAAEETRTA